MASNSDGIFTDTMGFLVSLQNFPEWAIPFTKVVPRITLPEGKVISDEDVKAGCRHWWFLNNPTDNSAPSWFLYVEINCVVKSLDTDGNIVISPSYVDLDLVILNEQIFEEINAFKS